MRDGDSPARRCVLLCFGAVFHSLASLLASHNFLGSRLPKKGPEEKGQGWVNCQARARVMVNFTYAIDFWDIFPPSEIDAFC